ncbi:sodium:proton antiporter NhaD [Candidatus Kaiserbacteria bacterium]|nr:sodium:proton antiporter NhaD [Candidatus Kaiserbacteria bacterium]MCB9818400.1 sodium:proton antiporter NhaD [Candidatus Nomurabacteria bacterium]
MTQTHEVLDLTSHWVGYVAIVIFVAVYLVVILEERIHLRKSKPVLLGAGLIWIFIAMAYVQKGMNHTAEELIRHNFLEFTEMFFFLFVAMTYINAMIERNVFDALRTWLVRKGFGLRSLFWMTGALAFFISPIADNLTTALIMGAVILSVGGEDKKFISIGCVNIVVAANAGGAFSPFGDITTLMVWQKGILPFGDFFALFLPSLVNWLIPATVMSFFVATTPAGDSSEPAIGMRRGAKTVMLLFLVTIITAVCFHNFLHLPPVYGMLFGLSFLKFFGYYLSKTNESMFPLESTQADNPVGKYDIFKKIERAEWDTLFFFYGIIMCVGGLGVIGYLEILSKFAYDGYGAMTANVLVGVLSAIVDNIPVMFAVLTMNPDMSAGQWLLVTLTAGVGGSLLSIGSAAGVALMGGRARGKYTFFGHLKWTPVIALGYVASILVHYYLNQSLF